ncbi:MAG: MOP flippase family protein [Acidobacteriota bacterium]
MKRRRWRLTPAVPASAATARVRVLISRRESGRQTLALALGMILARLLSPREFGLIGMVIVFSGFASLISEFGFGAAIIQRAGLREEHLYSVFWSNLLLGFVLCGGFALAAPAIAGFYGEPRIVPIARLLALTFVIDSFPTVPRALLIKNLDFHRIAKVEISAAAGAGAVAIAAALAGLGVWSLVLQILTFSVINACLFWIVGSWRPRFRFELKAVLELLGFGASLLGSRSLGYWRRNIDSLLVGRLLGIEALGFYDLSYRIMLIPVWNVSQVLSRVLFSSFSQIQEQRARIRRLFLRSLGAGALVTFPLMTGLLATARPFVLTILGAKWLPMVPILQILCVASLSEAFYPLTGNLFLSQGRADLQFKVGLFTRLMTVAGIVAGLHWGVTGVAAGFTVASILNLIPGYRISCRLVELRTGDIIRDLTPIALCTAGMMSTVVAASWWIPETWPHWAGLSVEVALGVSVYAVLIQVFRPRAYTDGLTLLNEWLRGEWQLRLPQEPEVIE